jgi:hypothetical protein
MPDDLDQPKLGKHGGKRVKGLQDNAAGNGVTLRSRGNSVAYYVAKLERDGRLDLVEAIRNRKTSAFAVAVDLGWARRPEFRYGQPRRRRIDVAALIG